MIPLITHLALCALAPAPQVSQPATLNAYYETDRAGLRLTAEISGATGPAFALLARTDTETARPSIVAIAQLDANGYGRVRVAFPIQVVAQLRAENRTIELFGVYVNGTDLVETPRSSFSIGATPTTSLLDFDYTIGDDSEMVAGRILSNQWQDIGLAITADNTRVGGPDLPILFDSANPTGGDFDLRTPNPSGYNNTVALGKLLIIAENSIDANNDGLIDDPDDEALGGSLIFDFDNPATISSVTLVDVDESPGTELRFYRNGNLTVPDETIAIASLGDGSVQTVTFMEEGVDRFEVFLQGSGAVADLTIDTCPTQLSFDETSTGVPWGLPAGTWMRDQLNGMGVTISATNNTPGHPNKAILFDTLNPTGGDWDLRTPNPSAPGNTEPLGFVLIIAENDIDLNGDGLVDDPDDEAGGGTLRITWDYDVTFLSTRVLDVDGGEIDYLRLFDAMGNEISTTLIPDAPDGAVQRITPSPTGVSGVRTAVLELGGSGALTRIRFCPDPAR
ncbi:MAG: hypothetical protein IPM29_11510 [Planctomycetes bacterium]|nr:hypothetical protein [Planctomycetota bacterium]